VKLMFENATLISDSGGRVRATLKIIQGSDRIARLLVGVRGKQVGVAIEKLMRINHDLGIVTYVESQAVAILWFEIDGMKIRRVNRILNPDKLKRVPGLGDERRGEVHLTGRMAL